MPTFSSMEVAVLSVASVIFFVFSCVSLSSFYLWFKVADTFWMKPRWSKWQMGALCTVLFCYVGPRCALHMWLRVWIKEPPEHSSTQRTAHLLGILLFLGLLLIWLILTYARMWLTYFDANLCMELAALEWKQLIDTRERDADGNWFVASQNTWGNPSLVFKIGTPLALLLIVALLAFTIFDFELANFMVAFIVIFTAGVWALFAKKYPGFHDCIHLREEATLIMRVSVAFVIFYVFGSALFFWVKAKDDSVAFVLAVAMLQLGNSLYVLTFQLTCVNYVASFFEKPSLVICGIPILFHLDSESKYRRHATAHSSSQTQSDKRINLFTVLRHDIGCRLLMSHLLSELSHDNLLALIECVKFRERMAVVCGVQLEASDKIRAANLFGSEVNDTQSSIVAEMKSPADAPPVYAALCHKYVDTVSPTAINISYLQRRYAQSFVDADSELGPFCLDPFIGECVFLLRDSFFRFSRTEEYTKFASEYSQK